MKSACHKAVAQLCAEKPVNKMEECLKEKFADGEMNDVNDPGSKCRDEVKRVLDEGAVDIQADPILQKTCSLDIERHCIGVQSGNGRRS